ncbi:hypothetical protein B0H17DRAFT_1133500 [Mycena rosella]|uniref:Uncharacterized protein n=1 Tax=Mycena rosella TaxID=1033263 RepID=A0AAD7DL08_MYCRO|nr:hypothetical protein B0H17DRAFT_1133500 [Mycena rosella]
MTSPAPMSPASELSTLSDADDAPEYNTDLASLSTVYRATVAERKAVITPKRASRKHSQVILLLEARVKAASDALKAAGGLEAIEDSPEAKTTGAATGSQDAPTAPTLMPTPTPGPAPVDATPDAPDAQTTGVATGSQGAPTAPTATATPGPAPAGSSIIDSTVDAAPDAPDAAQTTGAATGSQGAPTAPTPMPTPTPSPALVDTAPDAVTTTGAATGLQGAPTAPTPMPMPTPSPALVDAAPDAVTTTGAATGSQGAPTAPRKDIPPRLTFPAPTMPIPTDEEKRAMQQRRAEQAAQRHAQRQQAMLGHPSALQRGMAGAGTASPSVHSRTQSPTPLPEDFFGPAAEAIFRPENEYTPAVHQQMGSNPNSFNNNNYPFSQTQLNLNFRPAMAAALIGFCPEPEITSGSGGEAQQDPNMNVQWAVTPHNGTENAFDDTQEMMRLDDVGEQWGTQHHTHQQAAQMMHVNNVGDQWGTQHHMHQQDAQMMPADDTSGGAGPMSGIIQYGSPNDWTNTISGAAAKLEGNDLLTIPPGTNQQPVQDVGPKASSRGKAKAATRVPKSKPANSKEKTSVERSDREFTEQQLAAIENYEDDEEEEEEEEEKECLKMQGRYERQPRADPDGRAPREGKNGQWDGSPSQIGEHFDLSLGCVKLVEPDAAHRSVAKAWKAECVTGVPTSIAQHALYIRDIQSLCPEAGYLSWKISIGHRMAITWRASSANQLCIGRCSYHHIHKPTKSCLLDQDGYPSAKWTIMGQTTVYNLFGSCAKNTDDPIDPAIIRIFHCGCEAREVALDYFVWKKWPVTITREVGGGAYRTSQGTVVRSNPAEASMVTQSSIFHLPLPTSTADRVLGMAHDRLDPRTRAFFCAALNARGITIDNIYRGALTEEAHERVLLHAQLDVLLAQLTQFYDLEDGVSLVVMPVTADRLEELRHAKLALETQK